MAICRPNQCAIASTVVFSIFGIAYIVGFSVSEWYEFGASSVGLWEYCMFNHCFGWELDDLADYFKATQALMCMALILVLISGTCHVIWLCNISPSMTRSSAQAAAGCSLTGGLCGVVGVIVFAVEFTDDVELPNGYGFWLSAVSSVLLALHGSISMCWGCAAVEDDTTTMALAQAQVAQMAAANLAQQQPQVVYVQQEYAQQGAVLQVHQPQQAYVVGTQAYAPQSTVVVANNAQPPVYALY